MRRWLAVLLLCLCPLAAAAQADDKAFLTRLLQDNLSGAGRVVNIEGFRGALSSRASLTEMTIADDQGIWLTLRGVSLDWNRAALLQGRVEITSLTADEVILPRAPSTGSDTTPNPEARRFALPELPVSVSIGSVLAQKVTLGAALLGAEAVVSVQGAMQLSGGEGSATLAVRRIDGAEGTLALTGSYNNASRQLALDLALAEEPGGITAALLNLPGDPAVGLSLKGAGPIDDFTAGVNLQTNGSDRLAGTIRSTAEASGTQTLSRLRIDLSGDVAPLFTRDYRSFFGPDIRLTSDALRYPDGRIELTALDLRAAQLTLSGSLALSADGLPEAVDIQGAIAAPDGAPVLLPLPGDRAQVNAATLALQFDAATSDQWAGQITLDAFQRADFGADRLTLKGTGRIARDPATGARSANASLTYAAEGLLPADPALATAIGPQITGRSTVGWSDSTPVTLSDFVLNGADYALTLSGALGGIDSGLRFTGQSAATFDSTARLSELAGRPLSGAVLAEGRGYYDLLTGGFDLTASLQGENLALDQPELDRLLQGATGITLAARRDETGTLLRTLTLTAASLTARATGTLRTGATDLTADLDFTSLGVLGPSYGGALKATARITGDSETLTLALNGTGRALSIGQPQLDRLLAGETRLALNASRGANGTSLDGLTLLSGPFTARAKGAIPPTGPVILTSDFSLGQLAALDPGYSGSLAGTAKVTLRGDAQAFDVTATGTGLGLGQPLADRLLAGPARLAVLATRDAGGITLQSVSLATAAITASGSGTIANGTADLATNLSLPDLSVIAPTLGGSLAGDGTLSGDLAAQRLTFSGTTSGLQVGLPLMNRLLAAPATLALKAERNNTGIAIETATLAGPALRADVAGLWNPGASRLRATLAAPALSALGAGYRGTLSANADYAETGTARRLALQATANGLALGQPQFDRVMAGTTTLDLAATEDQGTVAIERFVLKNPALSADATVGQSGSTRTVNLAARLSDFALLAPGFTGPLALAGTLTDSGGPYGLNLAATGPGGLAARITGTTARSLDSAVLAITGQAQAALVNDIIAPRSVQGPVSLDLKLTGPLRLASLSGTLRTSGARLVTGLSGLTMDGITASATLGAGRAVLAMQGNGSAGGQVSVAGPVALAAPYSGDLAITLSALGLRDPNLYETTLTGPLRVSGPVIGGARITGTLDLGQTDLQLPSTGLGGADAIPDIVHLNEPAAVQATRARAGLLRSGAGAGLAPAARVAYPIDITLNAPRRVFIRGRGLDAELGGTLRLTGSTAAIVPVGDLTLIRGRLDLLGKRFTLDEGLARLQGRFLPFIRLVASTASDGITTSIVIEGDATAPRISFTSAPPLPEEEVLARLLFGRALTSISPLQAAQLASAVATLAGRGGEGIIGKLRKSFGLDDLDIQTDAGGNAALRAGKYLSDNVYTDVTIGADGKSAITLNLDLSPSVTLRGKAGSDGNTGFGLFYEKDY